MLNDLIQANAVEILDFIINSAWTIISLVLVAVSFKLPAGVRATIRMMIASREEKLRQALHQAARTGIQDGAQKGLTGAALVSHALVHMVKSVPGTIIELTGTPAEIIADALPEMAATRLPKPVRDVLENIVRAKLREELGSDA